MNILVLGGAGFLGNNLVRKCLQDKENKITVLDSLDTRLKSDIRYLNEVADEIEFIKGDICDSQLMEKIVQHKDVIFNCAAQTSHPLSFKDPLFDVEVNCSGSIILLEAVRKFNKDAKIIYTSSSTVIGKAVGEVVSEDQAERPLDIYSANKGVAEKYYYIYNRVYELDTLVLRFANLYGPYGKGYPEFGFINYFISLARAGSNITLYGSGRQMRNIMYVEDTVNLLYECIAKPGIFGEIYFAVHRKHYSVRAIAEEIVSVFGQGKVVSIEWPDMRRRIEVDGVIISGAKLFHEIQWEPKYDLRLGLEKTKQVMEKEKTGNHR